MQHRPTDTTPSAVSRLPRFERKSPSFADLFDVSASEVIKEMDGSGLDIPNQCPTVRLQLDSVGCEYSAFPIDLVEPFSGTGCTIVSCEVKVGTLVPSDRRGIHMSRIANIIGESAMRTHRSLTEAACHMADRIRRAQYGEATTVELSGALTFCERVEGRTQDKDKVSLENIGLVGSAKVTADSQELSAGVIVDHLTACPCVQETYRCLQRLTGEDGNQDGPRLTHSQRCRTEIVFRECGNLLPLGSLLEEIDTVIFRTQSALPREEELALVFRAHSRPQFIEDAARDLLAMCQRLAMSTVPSSAVEICSRSMESIHGNDIVLRSSWRAE